MKYLLIILLIIVLLTNLSSALCEEDQIDINTASAEELDEIVYIGPARAEQIIALRPFDSINDMIRIVGIGEVYLSAIKSQGLACVGEDVPEEVPEEPAEEKEEDEETTKEEEIVEEHQEITEIRQEETGPIELNIINLNPKVIKSENDNEKLNNNYAIYGFVFFCVLIIVLFVLRGKRYKNEFK
jgi:hypothetical protein